MKKVIGIVSEGPTDHMVMKAAIDRITGEENQYLSLQPESDMMGRYGNGWKGVWRWCKETDSIIVVEYSMQDGGTRIVMCYGGEPFDIRNTENELSLAMLSGTAEEIRYSYDEAERKNRVEIGIKT